MTEKPKRPRDANQLAKSVVDIATGESVPSGKTNKESDKNQAAVELGRLGGKKGGKARAAKLTTEQRREIARRAAAARWSKHDSRNSDTQ